MNNEDMNKKMIDPDASINSWDECYKIIYNKNRWDFWAKFDYDNLKKTYNKVRRFYARIKINENYQQLNKYPAFKMSGDTDFNFGKSKKTKKKYEEFMKLLQRDFSGDKLAYYLDKLDECNKMYHSLENFSFMPMTGGLQLLKGACEYDRLDVFVYWLSRYYNDKEKYRCKLRKTNRDALECYLGLFDNIYDYCSKIYMIDCKVFVDKIIFQGKESIESGESVVRYMMLAEEFWKYKRVALNYIY